MNENKIGRGITMRVGRILVLFFVAFSCLCFSYAQGLAIDPNNTQDTENQPYEIITEYQKIIEVIETTNKEILLRVDTLRNQDIAEALRKAIVERGVDVYMMIPNDGLEDNGSYFLALASIGAKTRIADGQGAFLVSDRTTSVFGSMLENAVITQGDMMTMKVISEHYAATVTQHFIDAYSKLESWDWQIILKGKNQ